ncbi:hypothetical protein FDUTEX481_09497 [Tolypothrix sp. PCC 7601]|nr:hypothetical protein FDUTEX481_09497 [Tolypothrix sp. PCC 7601]
MENVYRRYAFLKLILSLVKRVKGKGERFFLRPFSLNRKQSGLK